MRVATTMLHHSVVQDLQNTSWRMLKLQAQIASGRLLLVPSDNPLGAERALRARSDLRATEQWARNLEQARRFVTASETAVAHISDLMAEFRVLATKAADEGYGSEEMKALAEEIDGLLEDALASANAHLGGVRLFAGLATNDDPFAAVRDEDGRIVRVEVARDGTELAMRRQVDENVVLTINVTGSDLFGESLEFFEHLIAVRDAADSGDHEAVRSMLEDLDEDSERIAAAHSLIGVLMTRIEGMRDWLETQKIELEATRSGEEDLDVARALVDYSEEQAMLEAALATTTRLLDLTLVKFLG